MHVVPVLRGMAQGGDGNVDVRKEADHDGQTDGTWITAEVTAVQPQDPCNGGGEENDGLLIGNAEAKNECRPDEVVPMLRLLVPADQEIYEQGD